MVQTNHAGRQLQRQLWPLCSTITWWCNISRVQIIFSSSKIYFSSHSWVYKSCQAAQDNSVKNEIQPSAMGTEDTYGHCKRGFASVEEQLHTFQVTSLVIPITNSNFHSESCWDLSLSALSGSEFLLANEAPWTSAGRKHLSGLLPHNFPGRSPSLKWSKNKGLQEKGGYCTSVRSQAWVGGWTWRPLWSFQP